MSLVHHVNIVYMTNSFLSEWIIDEMNNRKKNKVTYYSYLINSIMMLFT